jgi:hypothetical protein
MAAMQFSLFNAPPQVATVGIEPGVNARNAKRQLDTLRKQLATAQADLEVYRLGSYPVKVMRWIRHLIFTLNAERRDVLSAITDLEPKVTALSQIIGSAIQ